MLEYCERCGKRTRVFSMSFFNEDMCCSECLEKEKNHPSYEYAKMVELEEVKKGNYNYKGIGKPKDL